MTMKLRRLGLHNNNLRKEKRGKIFLVFKGRNIYSTESKEHTTHN